MMKPTDSNPTPPTGKSQPPSKDSQAAAAKPNPGSLLTGTGDLVIEHGQKTTPPESISRVLEGPTTVAPPPANDLPPGSTIASDMVFEGTASLEPTAGSLLVLGRVEGNINGTPAVNIAAGGQVIGNISQPVALTIEGTYKGDVTADQVKIGEKAITAGTISYKRITILGGDNEIQLKPIRRATNE